MLKYIKPLSIYAVSNLFGKGTSFILLIILSHYLAPDQQGLYALFTVYVGVLYPLTHMGIINASQVKKLSEIIEATNFTNKKQFGKIEMNW